MPSKELLRIDPIGYGFIKQLEIDSKKILKEMERDKKWKRIKTKDGFVFRRTASDKIQMSRE